MKRKVARDTGVGIVAHGTVQIDVEVQFTAEEIAALAEYAIPYGLEEADDATNETFDRAFAKVKRAAKAVQGKRVVVTIR